MVGIQCNSSLNSLCFKPTLSWMLHIPCAKVGNSVADFQYICYGNYNMTHFSSLRDNHGAEEKTVGEVNRMKRGKIVALDDNKNVLSALQLLFKGYFEEATLISYPFDLIETIRVKEPDVLLLDMNFKAGINNGNEGLYWLSEVKKRYPNLPVVLFTAYADVDLAVEALKRGASDFVVKPWDNQRLIDSLYQAMDASGKIDKKKKSAHSSASPSKISLGKSPAMRNIVEVLQKVAPTNANLLITGENGTGKEVFANYVHQLSNRHSKPMVHVDMGAITESLFESELFGHNKGAFTDAHSDRVGKIEAADGGTLFLDEIGNLKQDMQSKLLVALQKREVVRVGGNKPIPFDVRLISATNCNIFDQVASGAFREDLLYRINTIHVEIPPLRERPEDIPELAEMFLEQYADLYSKAIEGISEEGMNKLTSHTWNGNVRELRHAIEKAVILSDKAVLTDEDFHFEYVRQRSGSKVPITLEAMECQLIRQTLDRTNNNITLAADELGISRPTLYSKIKKYNL